MRASLGKFIVFIVLERRLLVWRKTLYLGSLKSNDLPRHFISIEETKVITIDDVIDSTVMHINDFPRPNSTLTRQ